MILYAIKDLTADRMYFNARGRAYRNEDKALAKLKVLKNKYSDHVIYIVKFVPITLTPPTSAYI